MILALIVFVVLIVIGEVYYRRKTWFTSVGGEVDLTG